MPRIRSVKPEFWSSEQNMACSRDARLLFIGLWNFCDDKGRYLNSPKTVKAQVFPGDDDATPENVRRWLDELSSNNLIRFYEVDGKSYLFVTGWYHQKIDKPQPAKYPAPPIDCSPNDPRTVSTDRIGEDLKGSESIGAGGDSRANGNLIEEGWKPSAVTISMAKEQGLTDADIIKMVARFVPHYRSKGERSFDWDAKLQSWLPDEAAKLGRVAPAVLATRPPVKKQVHIKADTDEWRAWCKHLGKVPPTDSNFGWHFDSRWPPGHEGRTP